MANSKPLQSDDSVLDINNKSSNTPQVRNSSIRTKIIAAFAVVAFVSLALLGTVIYISFRNQVRQDIRQRLLNMVSIAALQQNAELHASIQNPGDEESDAYKKIKAINSAIVTTEPDIAYLYTMRLNGQGQIYFVVDTGQPGDEDTAAVAEIYEDSSPLMLESFATLDHPIAEEEFYTDQWGTFLSAYAPFYTEDGRREGVIGIDIEASKVIAQERAVLILISITTLGAMFLAVLLGSYFGNTFSKPIISLSQTAQNIIEGNLNARAQIESTDEVGDLAKTFNLMTSQLQETLQGLEQRVQERTTEIENRNKELDNANINIQRRSAQFEALAQVAQSITLIRDIQELLPNIANVVAEKYGFYHVGVFLIDEANEYAVLTATNSEGGKKMLERKHRLKVGEQGIVGSVTGTGIPRIALDVGADAVFFNNPDLPETHSEMALPLQSGNKVIGALDVQSTESGAFTDEDVQTLSLLADQVSLAIENAQLFENSNRTLSDLQTIMRQSTRDAWKTLSQRQDLIGYRYNAAGASPLKEPVKLAETSKGKKKDPRTDTGSYVVPIELRGEVIGNLVVQSPTGEEWNEDQQDIIKAVAQRVALSAENARLFEETSQRAERERLVSDITGKIRSHADPTAMIETAVNELKNALGASRIEIIPQKTDAAGRKDSEV